MFDGTDLNVAYGSYSDGPSYGGGGRPQTMNMPQNTTPEPPQVPAATASHEMPPNPVYNPPNAMYAQQSPNAKPAGYTPPPDGFWDRIALKKWDVLKVFMMSLIIVLALSIDNVCCHYMTSYIGSAFLTPTHEFIVRISYPVALILFIWLMKASV